MSQIKFSFLLFVVFCVSCQSNLSTEIVVNNFGLGGEEMEDMWVQLEGHSPATRVYFNEEPVYTRYIDSTLMTCHLPDRLLQGGYATMQLRDKYFSTCSQTIVVELLPYKGLTETKEVFKRVSITDVGMGGVNNRGLWVKVSGNLSEQTLIHINGEPRETFKDSGVYTCRLPESLVDVEDIQIQMIDTTRDLKSNLIKGIFYPNRMIYLFPGNKRQIFIETGTLSKG